MLEELRDLPRRETALVLVVLAIAAGGGYLYWETLPVKEEIRVLQRDRTIVDDDASVIAAETAQLREKVVRKQEDLGRVRQNLEDERSQAVQSATLTTLQEAVDLSSKLIALAADRDLTLGNFDSNKSVVSLGPRELSAINYSLVATGPYGPLLDMLRIVDEVATVRIGTLVLDRDPDDPTHWTMKLDLEVVYGEEG